ncbi:hypothetical protein [Massilia consociata]|uniref:Uncharacterized protein n=1 Tax=Massilia consociata TaxID=760117 RepID=A0ABV6FFE7_9BURK
MSQAQEAILLALRQSLYLPLDDLLFITKQYINPAIKDYEPGFIYIDIKYLQKMPDETSRRDLFVAI